METNLNVLTDILPDNEGGQSLINMIEQIMAIPEEQLNDASIEMMIGMIRGAFTESIRSSSIKELLHNFEDENLTRNEIINNVNTFKEAISETLDELKPSPKKRQILDEVFNIFYEMFDTALEQYHSYSIILPMKLEEGAQAPTYAHDTDACADIYASQNVIVPAHTLSIKVPTGLRIALPEGWVAKIAPRSSIGAKTGLRLSNSIGIIDADYRGEIGVLYDNISDSDYEIKAGDRIAQMWVEKVERFKPAIVDILPATERGEGGFGSSGK